jgi:serine/threonine protein kinase
MHQEATNMQLLASAGARVPHVLDGNTEQFDDLETTLYFVMEFVQGSMLAEIVSDRRGLGIGESVSLALALCETLRSAFAENIVHRDIKPENIIIRDLATADAVIVDFGLSFNEDSEVNVTLTHEALDNTFISLPERRGPAENKRDPRSDLTGIAAILFYCLTTCKPRNLRDSQGRPPHRIPAYSLDSKVSDPVQRRLLNEFFDRAFQNEIASRFQTIEEIVARLQEILNPVVPVMKEDLAVVLRNESAALHMIDRVAQIAKYKSNATTMIAPIIKMVEAAGKAAQNTSFQISYNHTVPKASGLVGETDLQVGGAIHVVYNFRDIFFEIQFRIVARGPECELLRTINRSNRNGSEKHVVEQWMPIARWLGEHNADAELIQNDLRATIARCVRLLGDYVRGEASS